jgi:DNA-binding transcriptional MerR regulator
MTNGDGGVEFSIKAVSQATGLTVATLRAWERRYGIIEPRRNQSGHRVYSAWDVSRLRRLRETTDRGHPISKIAHLSDEDLGFLLAETREQPVNSPASRGFVDRILASVEKYEPDECDQAIALAFALLPVSEVISAVLSPALWEVGDRWHRGEFTVGQERLISSAVRRQLSSLLNTYSTLAQGSTVVFATVSGELHELGILMHAALAASRKLRVCYLGADLPPEEIANFAGRVGAAAVAISMVMPDHLDQSLQHLAALRRSLPAGVEIWIGGATSTLIDPARFPSGSILMPSRRDFEQRVDLMVNMPRS